MTHNYLDSRTPEERKADSKIKATTIMSKEKHYCSPVNLGSLPTKTATEISMTPISKEQGWEKVKIIGNSYCDQCTLAVPHTHNGLPEDFTSPNPQQGDWEKELETEFNEMFNLVESHAGISERKRLKDFISAQIQQAERKGWDNAMRSVPNPNYSEEEVRVEKKKAKAETLKEVEQIIRDTLSADTAKSHKEINSMYQKLDKLKQKK